MFKEHVSLLAIVSLIVLYHIKKRKNEMGGEEG
jgi:hypothetical protein